MAYAVLKASQESEVISVFMLFCSVKLRNVSVDTVEGTFKGENMDQYPDLSRPGEEPKPAKRFVGRLEFVTGVWA
jgi:hypothetical protein